MRWFDGDRLVALSSSITLEKAPILLHSGNLTVLSLSSSHAALDICGPAKHCYGDDVSIT